MNVNEHIVSLAPLELTWLSIQTQTTTLLPANQISPCLRRGNERPITRPSAPSDNGRRTNQLSVWMYWRGSSQPISCLSGLHGEARLTNQLPVWLAPRGWASAEAQSTAQCCLPVPGNWWWGSRCRARQDRTVNPETVRTEAKGDIRWVRGCAERPGLRREMFWNGSGGIHVGG